MGDILPDVPISSTRPLRFDPLRENELFCFHLGNGGGIYIHTFSSTACVSSVKGGKNTSTSVWVFVPGILGTLILNVPELQEKFCVFPGDDWFKGFTTSTLETISIV